MAGMGSTSDSVQSSRRLTRMLGKNGCEALGSKGGFLLSLSKFRLAGDKTRTRPKAHPGLMRIAVMEGHMASVCSRASARSDGGA